MNQLVSLYGEPVGLLVVAGGAFGWLWRWIVKRFEQLELKLEACEQHKEDGKDRRAKMWRIIDMLLDAIEDIEPDHRKLPRVRSLLSELREDEHKHPMEPAE